VQIQTHAQLAQLSVQSRVFLSDGCCLPGQTSLERWQKMCLHRRNMREKKALQVRPCSPQSLAIACSGGGFELPAGLFQERMIGP